MISCSSCTLNTCEKNLRFRQFLITTHHEHLTSEAMIGVLLLDHALLCHERPFGGKLDLCIVPFLDSLTYLNVFRAVHSPFHSRSIFRFASSCIFGIQNPPLYSRSSVVMCWSSRSSRVFDGRPGLRWLLSSASSSS